MLLEIQRLLSPDELQTIGQQLRDAEWQPGAGSAGEHARSRKHNLEMNQQTTAWKTINQLVVTRLYEHPEFQRCVLPSKMSAAFV